MRLTQASIYNFRGIKKLELDTEGKPCIVHGNNGAGKTSLCVALQMVLAGITLSSRIAPFFAHDGHADGYIVQMSAGDDKSAKTVASIGRSGVQSDTGEHDDKVAVGLTSLCEMKPKERLAHYVNICREKSLDSVDAYFEGLGVPYEIKKELMDEMTKLEKEGRLSWEELNAKYAEQLRDRKREWEKITGERFGELKAANWRSDKLPIDERRSFDELTEAHEFAEKRGGELQKQDHELVHELWLLDNRIDDFSTDLNNCDIIFWRYELTSLQEDTLINGRELMDNSSEIVFDNAYEIACDQLREEIELHHRLKLSMRPLKCPDCQSFLILPSGDKKLIGVSESQGDKDNAAKITECENEITQLQAAIREYHIIKRGFKECKIMTARRREIIERRKSIAGEKSVLEDLTVLAERKVALMMTNVAKQHATVCEKIKILVDATAPEGIRKIAAVKSLETLNYAMARAAGFINSPLTVTLFDDGTVGVKRGNSGSEHWSELAYASASEKWIANLLYQSVAAKKTKARCMIVDTADILSPAHTRKILPEIMKLNEGKIIVAMTNNGDGSFDFSDIPGTVCRKI